MLYVVTGLPGASKTLNTIKMVCEQDEFKNRAVYYNRIDDCQVDGWTELADEEVHQWYNLPNGSVVIVDEAYRHFEPLKRGADKPKHYELLAEIRHYGITMVMICQAATDIDSFVRKKAGRHYHYERHYGTKAVKQIQFKLTSGAVTDTDKQAIRDMAEIKTIKIDDKYFGLYKSAEVHTVKANIPWKRLALPAVALLFGVGCLLYFLATFGGGVDEPQVSHAADSAAPTLNPVKAILGGGERDEILSIEDYQPRIAHMPWTAPMYDKLMSDVKAAPLPKACLFSNKRNVCRCVTDQATYVDVGFDLCAAIVKNGFFDPTREPVTYSHRASPATQRNTSAAADVAPGLVIGAEGFGRGSVAIANSPLIRRAAM